MLFEYAGNIIPSLGKAMSHDRFLELFKLVLPILLSRAVSQTLLFSVSLDITKRGFRFAEGEQQYRPKIVCRRNPSRDHGNTGSLCGNLLRATSANIPELFDCRGGRSSKQRHLCSGRTGSSLQRNCFIVSFTLIKNH